MAAFVLGKRKRDQQHPYLSGNFAPIDQTCHLTPCTYNGTIPSELFGGEYIRNGGNPVTNQDLGRDAHWFDGDGMLSGVSFTRDGDHVRPEFVNQNILTDVYLSARDNPTLRRPILPSITTLVHPLVSFFRICIVILRSIFLVCLSRLPGSRHAIKKISVANTSIMYHDGRAMATCESGPPLRIALPSLETVGWFNGHYAHGEPVDSSQQRVEELGGSGLLSFMKEWTTAHPKVDAETGEMMLFHSILTPPYVQYSIIPSSQHQDADAPLTTPALNLPVQGISSSKMMHDFGASKSHTIIMDLPLSLDPLNVLRNKPIIQYDSNKSSRFGVFPRHEPSKVRWFETPACCIFHVANTWDEVNEQTEVQSVNLLACRLTSANLIFNAGNIPIAQSSADYKESRQKRMPFFEKYHDDPAYSSEGTLIDLGEEPDESTIEHGFHGKPSYEIATIGALEEASDEQCCLYYYSFSMTKPPDQNIVKHQFALSAIPFEFPSISPELEMSDARFVYGCTTSSGTFNSALGRAVKIDALVKIDARTLIQRGIQQNLRSSTSCVDNRSVTDVIRTSQGDATATDTIHIFQPPAGFFAQEPRFVRHSSASAEDHGYLLSYMFDESQLSPSGEAPPTSTSELWIINAQTMRDVVARVQLPQRVPYGLHGNWFTEAQVLGQRPYETVRNARGNGVELGMAGKIARSLRNGIVSVMGG